MSGPQQVVVSRDYRPASDQCARALEVLLKKPVREGGPPTAPKDDVKESNGYVATEIISKPS